MQEFPHLKNTEFGKAFILIFHACSSPKPCLPISLTKRPISRASFLPMVFIISHGLSTQVKLDAVNIKKSLDSNFNERVCEAGNLT